MQLPCEKENNQRPRWKQDKLRLDGRDVNTRTVRINKRMECVCVCVCLWIGITCENF